MVGKKAELAGKFEKLKNGHKANGEELDDSFAIIKNGKPVTSVRKLSKEEVDLSVRRVSRIVKIGMFMDRYPAELSGGQQQRVAIARTLAPEPQVLFMDEPLSNLDAKLREEARAWLRGLIVELGLSALCVTHDQTEAMAMSDRILLLKNGRIEQEGTPAELYAAPRSLYVAEFMGSNNRFEARVAKQEGESVLLAGEGWHLSGRTQSQFQEGDVAQAVIRLERVNVTDEPGENRIRASLLTTMYLGDRWEYLFQQGETRIRAYGQTPRPSGEYWLELPQHDCWVFASN